MIVKIAFANLEADEKNHFYKLKQSEQCVAAVHVTECTQRGMVMGKDCLFLFGQSSM